MWAKQSTAATLIVGPVLDSTGAEYTSAVIGDLSISKNGSTLTALAAAATLTHIANGQYTLVMTTGNLDTLGRAQITCNKSTYQMPTVGLVVVPAMVFDSLVLGTDVLQSDVTQFGGTAGTFASGVPTAVLDSAAILAVADQVWDEAMSGHTTAGTYGGRIVRATNSNTEVQITGSNHIAADIHNLQSGVISAGDFAANSITASALAADAVTEIQSGLATAAALATESTKITAIETFATRMTTGLVADGQVYQFTANMLELGPSGGGGGDATLAKQTEILAAIQGSAVIQVASPNVSGNLVLTQGDDYDGVANPKASWTVTTDYTSGWTVRLTIRSSTDAIIYTNTGTVVSSTVVAVTIAAPTGLTMTGCPGQWQGKFDVELTHSSGKKKTIALGVCYINEDQTR